MKITEDQILSLAPDESSKKSGKELSNPAKWVSWGANDDAIWGECQGSGSKTYQTQIDLGNIAFKCSCPSRKFPCKHGIALGLIYARQNQLFTVTSMPDWVNEWISKRAQKQEQKSTQVEKPVDTAAQAKRQQAREQKVEDGIGDLLIWIKDIVRNGLLQVPQKNAAYWDGMVRRMIDAQAPGLANMIKTLGSSPFFREGWQTGFLDTLLNIYLIIKAYQHRDQLDASTLSDVKSMIGFHISQEELKEQLGIVDTWLVLAKQVSEEDNLTVEKFWLQGLNTNRYALILQFLVRGQGASLLLVPGMFIEAELIFYPSVTPLRALIKRQVNASPLVPKQMFESWKAVAETESEACSLMPIRNERPYLVKQLLPVQFQNKWWLRDQDNSLIAMPGDTRILWKLLAISGGSPMDLVILGKENEYLPIGIWHNNTYKLI